MEVVKIPLDQLTPDPHNAKDHPKKQIEQIKESIEQFGNNDPIAVWGDSNLIVEGHGRYEALKELGYEEADCIRLDQLTEEERRAYGLVHNKLTMNSGFIPDQLELNLSCIGQIDMSLFGFDSKLHDWFKSGDKGEAKENEDEYSDFLSKFDLKHTTDDCYTPEKIYEAVAQWVQTKYNLNRVNFIRPFYPGGDYKNEKYKPSDIVVDNPPFSILSEILKFYQEKGIKYFLFCPALTPFSSNVSSFATVIITGVEITYKNRASVLTSFITNLESDDIQALTAPDLYKAIKDAGKEIAEENTIEIPKYVFPNEVITATILNYLCKYGIDFVLAKKDAYRIKYLDSMKKKNKRIYGSGFLISEKAAAEKAAAEKAAAEKAAAEKAAAEKAAAEKADAEKWELSEREKEIVKKLSNQGVEDEKREANVLGS
jgi:ParB-like chromosome segregation protein Spo0J